MICAEPVPPQLRPSAIPNRRSARAGRRWYPRRGDPPWLGAWAGEGAACSGCWQASAGSVVSASCLDAGGKAAAWWSVAAV